MASICFACGSEKPGPLVVCPKSQVKPFIRRERLASLYLSKQCLPHKQLALGAEFIKTKKKLPGFSKIVAEKATNLLKSLPAASSAEDISTSFEFSESFFDYDGNIRGAVALIRGAVALLRRRHRLTRS